ncbi:MAG TPA: hypothetical protein GXX20_11440 [Clostridiaceae bacterium]|nr:hypothetical protein [Clostridiaceae bacterium]
MYYHDHNYSGVTSFNDGHVHRYAGTTTFAPDRKGHIHYVEGVTSYEDGHVHTYGVSTSVDFPVPGGGHIHFIRVNTQVTDQHVHFIRDITDSPGFGFRNDTAENIDAEQPQ